MSDELTSPPWAWQKFGKEWCLTGQHGHRPIVLAVRKGALTSLRNGLLVPFDPEHPDAKCIASAPELLRQRDELLAALEEARDELTYLHAHLAPPRQSLINPTYQRTLRIIRDALARAQVEKGGA